MEFKPLLSYLDKLQKNNHKEWFEANRKEYETLRKNWLVFVSHIVQCTAAFDPDIAGLEAKNCIFRINRDIRFSKDKTPYKINFAMSLSKGGRKSQFCGYYLHIQPGQSFIAGGAYMPEPAHLAAIRQEIDYNADEFEGIVSSKEFKQQFGKLSGDKLSRPPKGYEQDNPAVEYLKHKDFLAERMITDEQLLHKDFEKTLLKTFLAMKPLNDFLNRAINP